MASKSQRKKRRSERLLLQCSAPNVNGPFHIECDLPIEFQAAAGGDDKKLPTFTMNAYTGGKMLPRGFITPVVADLTKTEVASGVRPIFLNHDPAQIVGHGNVEVTRTGIKVTDGVMSGAGPAAQEVRISAANGFPWKASIGANPERMEYVDAGKQVEVNGRKFNGPLYVARGLTVHEVSFVPLAGDNRTSATVAASLGESAMGFEAWLKAKGIDLAKLDDATKTTLQAAYDAEQKINAGGGTPNTPPNNNAGTGTGGGNGGNGGGTPPINAAGGPTAEDGIAARRRAEADEEIRISAIRALFQKPELTAATSLTIKTSAGEFPLMAHAIREGWTADATELYAMRNSRPAAAMHSTSHDEQCSLQALQGAVLIRAGVQLDHPMFTTQDAMAIGLPAWIRAGLNTDARQKAMENAWRFRTMSMFDLAVQACRLDGREVNPYDRSATIQAAFSGTNLSNVFTTNVNAVLLKSYLEAPDTTVGWCQEEDVPDFRTNERPRVVTGNGLEKLPPGKTASHDQDSDLKEEFKIARYAKQMIVDEQDIINDGRAFSILKTKPEEFGKAARRLRPDLVYYILLSNPTMGQDTTALFHANHNNLNTGAALASATLKTAVAKFELQTENSVNLNLKMTHLIVPPTLKHTGKELISSSTIIAGGDTSVGVRGSRNTLEDEELTLVADGRLENGVTDPDSGTAASGSASTWFGASTFGPTITVGYLNASGRVPQVRTFNLDRGQWGWGADVKMDIGAKAMDFRTMQKNTA